MPLYVYTDFTPQAVQPVQCLKEGWDLIKEQYWLFVGISAVAFFLGQLAPMGILIPPMVCGVYLVLFERMRGRLIEFGTVFKGFDYFGPGVIALLLHLIPAFVLIIPLLALFFIAGLLILPNADTHEPNPVAFSAFVALIIIGALVTVLVGLVVSVLFTFAYPLIVERQLSGVDAVRLSLKAAMANFWGLLGLLLLNGLLGIAGFCCCYVGVFLVMPIGLASSAIAYRQVFGLGLPKSAYPPAPPASFM